MPSISPLEASTRKDTEIPEFVLQIVNKLLTEHINDRSPIRITQDEIVERILATRTSLNDFSRQDVFDRHWLDFEGVYRKAGWKVEYDKPGYCDTYPATFIFTPKVNARGFLHGKVKR